MNNRPIDQIRNSSVTMSLPSNMGSIEKPLEINGKLHMIGNSAIYLVQHADEIDPQRVNNALPNTNQLILSYGTECLYVRQTLMTASRLFCNNVLGSDFDYKKGINLSFDALQDLMTMHDTLKSLCFELDRIKRDNHNRVVVERSMKVPSMDDLRGKTTVFLQKADHVVIALFNIAKLFYGAKIGKKWFDSLLSWAQKNYGDNHEFTKYLNSVTPFLKFVRDTRNAMEHPDHAKSITVENISLLPSGELNAPSITVIHPDQKTMAFPIPLLDFMKNILGQLATNFEDMLAHLCDVNVKPFAGIPLCVIEYDENQQRKYKCRYGYGGVTNDGNKPFI